MNKDDYVIVLFNGYGSSKIYWDYAFENKPDLRKLDFLDELKKIGKTYTFNQPFFNINYYSTPDDQKEKKMWGKIYNEYKPYSPNINFTLEDIDYKNICEKTYNAVKQKYGNNKKYIVIGHSYGGVLALLFSKWYKKDCVLCFCIDNVPYVLDRFLFFKNDSEKNNSDIIEKYSNNEELKKSLNIIKNSKSIKEKNKEINDIHRLIQYKTNQDNVKYYDTKLHIPTVFFRAYTSQPQEHQIYWFKSSKKEKKIFENDKNLKEYIIMDNADHYIWENQEFSDTIIDTIKKEEENTNKNSS
jgi:triacylglycerol esterase/lipase EstA (alpha/beta hydrolase family)